MSEDKFVVNDSDYDSKDDFKQMSSQDYDLEDIKEKKQRKKGGKKNKKEASWEVAFDSNGEDLDDNMPAEKKRKRKTP